MKELQESQKGIDLQITETEKQIHLIEKTTVSKTKLKEQYAKVGQIYGRMDKPAQRKIIHALIREIEFKYKKSEETGEIKMGFRGDGEIVEKLFKNINPETLVSRFYVGWLRR